MKFPDSFALSAKAVQYIIKNLADSLSRNDLYLFLLPFIRRFLRPSSDVLNRRSTKLLLPTSFRSKRNRRRDISRFSLRPVLPIQRSFLADY